MSGQYQRHLAACLLVAGTVFIPKATIAAGSQPPLRLVGDRDYPPLTYLESGVAKGVDVDMARAIAARIGRELRIDLMEWNAAQESVLRGEADGLLSMSITEERRRLYEFTEPTHTHAFGVFVRGNGPVIRNAADLATRRVGVTPGGYPRRFLQDQVTNLVLIENYADGFERISSGAVDAVAADTWVAAYTAERRQLRDVRLVGDPFATVPAAIALRANNAGLATEINEGIRQITADGTRQAILEQWRPHEVLFASRQRVTTLMQLGLGVLTAAVLCVSAVWAHALHGQVAQRRKAQTALVENERRLVTERTQIEERLQLLSYALQCTNDCVIISDASDRVLYVNATFVRTCEYSEDQILGQHLSVLGTTMSGRSIDAMLNPERRDGWHGELWTRSRNGRVFPATWATSIVRDDQGHMIAMIGVARDETLRHDLTNRLQQSQKVDAVGRLAAGVAHDFNNLLTVIMTNGEEAIHVAGLPLAARQRLDDIITAAETAASLTRQLLTLGRRQMPEQKLIDLNDLLVETRRSVAHLIQPNVQLDVRPAAHRAIVAANPAQLQQVIVNLVTNARDAMPNGGRLVLGTRNVTLAAGDVANDPLVRAGEYVVLAVSDSGCGMNAPTLARIFEPFFTTKSPDRGTGLGLTTVHEIVTLSGGFVRVWSEPGVGSTFTVYLPAPGDAGPAATS